MSRLNVGNLFNENEDGAPVVSGISTFSSPNYFVPPSGSTAERPQNPDEGMIRFNTDSGHLEYYTGELWVDVIVNNNELGDQNNSNSTGGTGHRGLIGGGSEPGNSDTINYITISTLGNAQDFGNLSQAREYPAAGQGSSTTRGLFAGGRTSPSNYVDTIDFVTMASTGNASDFGNLTVGRHYGGIHGDGTRTVIGGGYNPPANTDVIDYVTVAQTGNAVDFGDLVAASSDHAAMGSKIRAIFGGNGTDDRMDYITISSTGNAQDFGNLTSSMTQTGGLSNSTRGIVAGGNAPSPTGFVNTIQYVTIATTGNAQNFGDLTQIRRMCGSVSSPTRGVCLGGSTPSLENTIDYFEILSTGNAIDFGDLAISAVLLGGNSTGHGGL